MGFALLAGALRSGVLRASEVVAIEPDGARREALRPLGVEAHERIGQLTPEARHGVLFLAIKPQMLRSFGAELSACEASATGGWTGVISILAGTPRDVVQSTLGLRCPCIRAMPNLPALLGQGTTAIADDDVPDPALHGLRSLAQSIFASVCPCVLHVPEAQLDACTAVAGSGPAYVFALAEAMIDGAQQAGLSPRDAHEAVLQTIIGAAAMLAETSGEGRPSPSVLRERVTSPGGTTQAGLAAMQQAGFAPSVRAAILAARDRGRELGAIAQGKA